MDATVAMATEEETSMERLMQVLLLVSKKFKEFSKANPRITYEEFIKANT